MTNAAPIPADQLAALANADTQRLAARMAQDVFAGAFRQAATVDAAPDVAVLGEVATGARPGPATRHGRCVSPC